LFCGGSAATGLGLAYGGSGEEKRILHIDETSSNPARVLEPVFKNLGQRDKQTKLYIELLCN
jgi:hypothetical protein